MEKVRPLKRSRDSWEPGTYKEALTNDKMAIFKETILQKSSQMMNKTSSLKNWKGCFMGLLNENYHT
jgi:hypothetical protein